jgi:N6-L-threonylcarbamoyladenine synthase
VRVLGIESSCDELAMAVLDGDGRGILANVIHSQVKLHAAFGGIVPEVASRDHAKHLSKVFGQTLGASGLDIGALDGIAVTRGPGLIGCLLCGLEFAKGLALGAGLPLIGVHHLEGHIAASYLEEVHPEPPFVALIVSGGHTSLYRVDAISGPYRLLGRTLDDAAGEAFDKTAKILGLGYPGGAVIDKLAQSGDPTRFAFPDAMQRKHNLAFSFSGLKTAAVRALEKWGSIPEGELLADFCASFQDAVVRNLVRKAFSAVRQEGLRQLVIVGGVAANRGLRTKAREEGEKTGIQVFLPSPGFCTDNGAMIARAGQDRLLRGQKDDLGLKAKASLELESLPC